MTIALTKMARIGVVAASLISVFNRFVFQIGGDIWYVFGTIQTLRPDDSLASSFFGRAGK
jgi:hypothetical protein